MKANFDTCFHATFTARLGVHSPNVDANFGAHFGAPIYGATFHAQF
jgi:hypothetical protein